MPFSRRCVIRSSMAAMTCGTHWPLGSSAVRHACISTDLVPASERDAATTSPAEFRQRALAVVTLERVLLVPDEGDPLVGLGPERRPGQAEPAGREAVGLLGRLAPG